MIKLYPENNLRTQHTLSAKLTTEDTELLQSISTQFTKMKQLIDALDGKLTNIKRSVIENGLRLEYLEANRIEQNKFFQNTLQKRIPLTTVRQPRTGRMIKRKAAEIEEGTKDTPVPPVKKKKGRKLMTYDVKRIPPTPEHGEHGPGNPETNNTIEKVECFICGEFFSCREMLEAHWDYSNCEGQLPVTSMTDEKVSAKNKENA